VISAKPLAKNHVVPAICAVDLKDILGQVDTDCRNLHGRASHGRALNDKADF